MECERLIESPLVESHTRELFDRARSVSQRAPPGHVSATYARVMCLLYAAPARDSFINYGHMARSSSSVSAVSESDSDPHWAGCCS